MSVSQLLAASQLRADLGFNRQLPIDEQLAGIERLLPFSLNENRAALHAEYNRVWDLLKVHQAVTPREAVM